MFARCVHMQLFANMFAIITILVCDSVVFAASRTAQVIKSCRFKGCNSEFMTASVPSVQMLAVTFFVILLQTQLLLHIRS